MIWLIYPITGVLVGLLATMFGFGGGFVVVPLLFWLLPYQGVPNELVMHVAIGTSLLIMLVNMSYATYLHYKEKNIDMSLLKKMLPLVIVGAVIGSLLTVVLKANFLRYIFILFMLYVIYQSIKKEFTKTTVVSVATPSTLFLSMVSVFTGIIAALLGIGGSVIIVPFCRRYNVPINKASGLANALALPSGLIGSVVAIIAGLSVQHLPPYSSGYIYWPAFIGIVIGGFIGAKLGIFASKMLPDWWYGKIYVALLVLVVVCMAIK